MSRSPSLWTFSSAATRWPSRVSLAASPTRSGVRLLHAAGRSGECAARHHLRRPRPQAARQRRPATLYRAAFEGPMPDVKTKDGVVTIRYARRLWGLAGLLGLADITLNAAIPWHIAIQGGSSMITAELAGLNLAGLEVKGGGSMIRLELPIPLGQAPIQISGGGSQIEVLAPPGRRRAGPPESLGLSSHLRRPGYQHFRQRHAPTDPPLRRHRPRLRHRSLQQRQHGHHHHHRQQAILSRRALGNGASCTRSPIRAQQTCRSACAVRKGLRCSPIRRHRVRLRVPAECGRVARKRQPSHARRAPQPRSRRRGTAHHHRAVLSLQAVSKGATARGDHQPCMP